MEAELEPEDGYAKIGHPEKSKPPKETQRTSKASYAFSYTMLSWLNNLYKKQLGLPWNQLLGRILCVLYQGDFLLKIVFKPP